ncbi:uncharacterized protein MYCFIDRAFT_205490 [Pseudocercospora fijiensis CIRAD86]|uniref:MIF4G domain-containing protein n=1 Tax=Pseudocercospora fijiensis (strain CIRAD86) TaxID=383855 RepID=M3AJR6_PSEFD|nr:uncharacterized protein MYCFIDRAFT_205490 [Pseudocercospora fijiensis CIRAD86]EME77413.1 hypothetical protein MYCFIDRAFT_205490 [Pseudocercospora fijiensis CIRAD86]
MTSAISSSSQNQVSANASSNALSADSTSSSLSGAVPAQFPARSYATATKTATPPTLAGASAPAQNAKPTPDAHMNGAMAQNGSQTANGAPTGSANSTDHGRKPSVVINASGASGNYPNGGPVQNGSRPAISFGSMNTSGAEAQQNAPFHAQNASLSIRGDNPLVISPAHSPSPIPPQPAASGGRPPSNLANNSGALAFGSMGPDTDMVGSYAMSADIGYPMLTYSQMRNQVPMPAHERRPSSQSMEHSYSNQGRGGFAARGGRGQSFTPAQQPFMPSPRQQYAHPMPGQPQRQFQQAAPGSPFQHGRQAGARQSPAPMHAQPHMGQQQIPYQGYSQLHPQHQQMYGMPHYDPNQGYYSPYGYPYGYAQPPQSPRPQYGGPFPHGTPQGNAPPFHPPPATPGMARTPSQASERPSSSMGHPQTPSSVAPVPSGTPGPNPQAPSSNFVRPAKKSSAIKITDAQGNAVDFKKPSPTPSASAQPQTPVIVSTPNAPTPPPRAASSQHNRTESQVTKSAEERKAEFQRQVQQRQAEERNKSAQDGQAKGKEADQIAEAAQQKEAEEKAAAEKAKADGEKLEAEKKKQAEEEKSAAAAAAEKDAAAAKKKQDDEEMERMIAEMEAEAAEQERKEAEAEKAYQEKKAKDKAAREAGAAERAAKADEELKRQEREAEKREEQRERERNGETDHSKKGEPDDEAKAMFASLKKATIGPSASASGADTPTSERDEEPAESSAPVLRAGGAHKPKPAHLKLETNKPVERAEPTPGMQALKSSRFLELKEEAKYPDGFKSPNPALNQAGQRKGRAYDKDFLLQFQSVFKEKPSVDWDQKVKETLGPGDDSARPQSARTPSGAMSRQGSGRPGQSMGNFGGAMGSFSGPMGPRTLPAGTTSEQRFMASQTQMGPPRGGAAAGMSRQPSQLGMGAPVVGMSRTNSLQMMGNMGGPNSPRQPSSRGNKGASRRDDRQHSKRQEAEMASKMPLTAHMEITPLEKSQSGWKPMSLATNPATAGPEPSGLMAPDMVQRKVKAALNKMTPEKFDRISDQILEIAAQSTKETDGRTLRQVIQLTFEKACDEAHWAGMYAKFCQKMLTTMSTDIRDETIKDKNGNPVVGGALFRKYLLNRCQEEFERGWQANLPDKPEGEGGEAALLSDEYYVAAAAKRRGLGLIQFIGQLYKLKMLTLRIMHECVMRLLNFEGEPDEAAVENLTTLLKSVGATMEEEEQGRIMMNAYFQRIDTALLKSESLGSRPRFMIMDLIDLRRAGWRGKDDAKGPKTIAQIHEEAEAAQAKAEAERQKSQRGGPGRPPAGRGDARNFSGGMPPPVDYNRTTVGMDDLRRLQTRGQTRAAGGSLGPGGGLGPSSLSSGRTGSRRGAGNLGPGSSANSTRTNTPPVDKKDEPSTAQNAFSALASLDASGDQPEEQSEAASPPAARNRSKSPMAADKDES